MTVVTIERRLGRLAAGFNARARAYRSIGIVSWEQLLLLHARGGGKCAYCGIGLDIMDGTWDHAEPLSEGGRNDITNIVRCCTSCQRRKFTKTPAEFAAHQELTVICSNPGCEKTYHPRWAEYKNGRARYCSHRCAGAARWEKARQRETA